MSDDAMRKTRAFNVCCECKLGCCQDVRPPLTSERKKIIENYLEKNGATFHHPFTRTSYSFPSVDAMGFCVFYDKQTKQCLVHHVKPETCRAGPVTFDINLRSHKVEWFLKKTEVCALAKRLCENEALLKEHFKVARAELLQLIREFDAKALRAILLIEEPQTFKIGEDELPKEAMQKLGLV